MTDPKFPLRRRAAAYVDNELPAERRGESRRGCQRIPRRGRAGAIVAHGWRKRCTRVTTPFSTRRCRSGLRSSGWCGSRAGDVGAAAAVLVGFAAGGGVGWIAHGCGLRALDVSEPDLGGLECAPASTSSRFRHPVEVRQRAHASSAMADQALRLDRPRTGTGRNRVESSVGGRLCRPTGPASFHDV